MTYIKKRDILLLAALLALGIGGWLFQKNLSKGAQAEISVGGRVVKTVSLSEDSTFEVGDLAFEVKNGGICVSHSPCRDQICVRTGFISSPAETIVCLPEKTAVRIFGKENAGADLIIG